MAKLGLALYAGGNRVFYNLGVLKRFTELGFKYDVVSTYSAGGGALPSLVSSNYDSAVNVFSSLTEGNKANFQWQNIIKGKRPFPHDDIYSSAIEKYISYEDIKTFDKEIRLIVSTVPAPAFLSGFIGSISFLFLAAYGASRDITKTFFLKLFKKIFSVNGKVVDLRNLSNNGEILNYILGSSTIYPFIRMRQCQDGLMLDGKMSLLSPIQELADCDYVLSIHAHSTFTHKRAGLTSLFPITPVSCNPLDYVGKSHYISAFNQGYQEADIHYEKIKTLPFFASANGTNS